MVDSFPAADVDRDQQIEKIRCPECNVSAFLGANFCSARGHPLKEETPVDRLNKVYNFCLMSGSCFDPDPGMRGNEHQNNTWLSAYKAAIKAGYPNPVARARSDAHYLLTQLNNGSTAPWFVRVCQGIWTNKTDSERDQIINTYCSFCCEQLEKKGSSGVLLRS